MADFKPISDSDFRRQIKTSLGTGYLFYGDEDYLKIHAARLVQDIVAPDPAFALFNIVKMAYEDYTPEKLVDVMQPPPMMADRKLILLTGFDFTSMRASETDGLCEALDALREYDFNTVILSVAAGLIDEGYSVSKPSATLKKLSEKLCPVKFDKCTPGRLAVWANKHFEHNGTKISDGTVDFFISYCGSSMMRLANEIEKLCAYVLYDGRSEVTREDVKTVCCADTEYDTFAFGNAIMEGRAQDALAILDYMRFKRVDPLIIFGETSKTFCDLLLVKQLAESGMTPADMAREKYMNEYRAKIYLRSASKISLDALHRKIALCEETDKKIKLSYGSVSYAPLEMLICT